MKKSTLAVCLACLWAVASVAGAAPEYYEGFDYPENDYTSDHGWTTGTSSLPFIIQSPGATYTDGLGRALEVSGNTAYQTVDGAHYNDVSQALPSTVTSMFANPGTFYVAALMREEQTLSFKDTITGWRGLEIGPEPAGTGYNCVLEVREGEYTPPDYNREIGYLTGRVQDTNYHLYALRIVNREGPDEITMLIDPNLANPDWDTPSSSRIQITSKDITSAGYSNIRLWGGGQGPGLGPAWIGGVDEIRIASTWEEAVTYGYSSALYIGDGSNWHFPRGDWTESGGVIRPPNVYNLHSRAFYKTKSYTDLTAEFDFNPDYRENGAGMCGLVIRASDANHFYLVYFPWGAQSLRAKAFWAVIAKVSGDGYIRNIKAEWVPGIPSETDRWYHVKVTASGPNISVTVDGRNAVSVTDATYGSGCVGLAGYGWYAFRNLTVTGTYTTPTWDTTLGIPNHTFDIGFPDSTIWPTGCVAPNGDILVAGGLRLMRSTDGGVTWTAETLPAKLIALNDSRPLFCTSAGRLIAILQQPGAMPGIYISESTDNGVTWSDPAESTVNSSWPGLPSITYATGAPVETADGTLVRFVYGVAGEGSRYTSIQTWSSGQYKAYALRSTDGGSTWSGAIEIDQPAWQGEARGTIVGSLDLTEITGVAIGNKVTALVRPVYSPDMWQCWSDDAGATWDAAARTTFPGYAQSMSRLSSGPILIAHRYPSYSVNVSYDDGLNWDEGTGIDYPNWAMGCVVNTGPDTALVVYMNYSTSAPLVAQLVRVKPDGIYPYFLLSDDFERNDWTAAGWINSGCEIQSTDKYSGAYAARLNSSDTLTAKLDTSGRTNIKVRYARHTRDMESDDHFISEWYNGSTWTTLEDLTGNSPWTVKEYSLPSGADNNPSFQVRFRTVHNGIADYAHVDEVKIMGL